MKKLTFAEARNVHEAEKNNSDLSNLAVAMAYVEQGQKELAALAVEIEKAAAAIEAGEVFPVDRVKDLYDRARRGRPSL